MGQIMAFPSGKALKSPLPPVIANYYRHRAEMCENAPLYAGELYLVGTFLRERSQQLPPCCLACMFMQAEMRKIAHILLPLQMGWN